MEGKSEIAAIANKYKATLNDLIDSPDTKSPSEPESPNRPESIDKETRNACRSESALPSFSGEDCLDKDISVILLGLVPEIQNSQGYKCHDVPPLGAKSEKTQDGEGKKDREDRKNKRNRENRKGERGGRGHCGNKINPVVGESSGSEASIYYHIIYRCYQRLMVLG